jgi:hypothetical protein
LDGVGLIPAIPPTQITCFVDHFNKGKFVVILEINQLELSALSELNPSFFLLKWPSFGENVDRSWRAGSTRCAEE